MAFLSHPAPWMRSRARILGSRPDRATSTASLKNTASVKKANVESAKSLDPRPRSRVRPTGTALVVIVLRYPRKEDSTMKRRLALVAVLGGALLAFGVQNAAAKHTCTYKGTDYSEGSASCQTGQQFRCADGEWKGLGVACSDNPAA